MKLNSIIYKNFTEYSGNIHYVTFVWIYIWIPVKRIVSFRNCRLDSDNKVIFLHMFEKSFMSFFEKVTTIISAKKSVYHKMLKWSTSCQNAKSKCIWMMRLNSMIKNFTKYSTICIMSNDCASENENGELKYAIEIQSQRSNLNFLSFLRQDEKR